MDGQNYRNEAAWRAQMLASQAGIRQSVSELGFVISGLFLAYLLSAFWPGLSIVVAAAMCGGSIFAVWRESRASARIFEEPEPAKAEQAN
jgi:hypothetical protein